MSANSSTRAWLPRHHAEDFDNTLQGNVTYKTTQHTIEKTRFCIFSGSCDITVDDNSLVSSVVNIFSVQTATFR